MEQTNFTGAKVCLDNKGNEFLKIANDRRSIRKFSKKPVDYDTLRKCIQAAGMFMQ